MRAAPRKRGIGFVKLTGPPTILCQPRGSIVLRTASDLPVVRSYGARDQTCFKIKMHELVIGEDDGYQAGWVPGCNHKSFVAAPENTPAGLLMRVNARLCYGKAYPNDRPLGITIQ